MKLIGQKVTGNLSDISNLESNLKEGESGEIRIYLKNDLSQEQLNLIENDLVSKGVKLLDHVYQDANILVIKFIK